MIDVCAFGALNQDSYAMFEESLTNQASLRGIAVRCVSAQPYPNAQAVSEAGRPLRAEALQDAAKRDELCRAVASDAKQAGAMEADVRCMPCMSMIGFHAGVEKELGKSIVSLAEALGRRYADINKLGVIHMRPAKARIEEIFGAKAITPDEMQSAKLLAAEEEAKRAQSVAPIETVMLEIVATWKGQGVRHILFARADAPRAIHAAVGKVEGVEIESYFNILAEDILNTVKV